MKSPAKTIDVSPLGLVQFRHSRRAKRLSVTVKSDLSVRVTIPEGVSLGKARKFLQSKIPWAKRHLDEIRRLQAEHSQVVSPVVDRAGAKAVLSRRLNQLARKHGLTYNRLFVRNQRTRWGSCSSKDNINLNVNLVKLPEHLRDYVILHELVHTRHKNHSEDFWAELDCLVGDSRSLQKQIRRYKLAPV